MAALSWRHKHWPIADISSQGKAICNDSDTNNGHLRHIELMCTATSSPGSQLRSGATIPKNQWPYQLLALDGQDLINNWQLPEKARYTPLTNHIGASSSPIYSFPGPTASSKPPIHLLFIPTKFSYSPAWLRVPAKHRWWWPTPLL
jgi:hypothetical protein